MDIRFPLLSILSCAFLLFFLVQGGDVELHSIELGFSADSQGVTVTIDPSFLVYADRIYPAFVSGETFGNVAVIYSNLRGTQYEEWIKRFELNHIKQYRALGWWICPATFVLQIDPYTYQPKHWNDPSEADRVEWLPPKGWSDIWHFIHFDITHSFTST